MEWNFIFISFHTVSLVMTKVINVIITADKAVNVNINKNVNEFSFIFSFFFFLAIFYFFFHNFMMYIKCCCYSLKHVEHALS